MDKPMGASSFATISLARPERTLTAGRKDSQCYRSSFPQSESERLACYRNGGNMRTTVEVGGRNDAVLSPTIDMIDLITKQNNID